MLMLRNFCYLIDWKAESKCRIKRIDKNNRFERFESFDRWFNRIVFFRVRQQRLDANIFINMIDVCNDEIFWFWRIKWNANYDFWLDQWRKIYFERNLRNFCILIDWKTNSKYRIETIDFEFNRYKISLENKLEIINDLNLIKHRKTHSFMYNVSFFLNFFLANIIVSLKFCWQSDLIRIWRNSEKHEKIDFFAWCSCFFCLIFQQTSRTNHL